MIFGVQPTANRSVRIASELNRTKLTVKRACLHRSFLFIRYFFSRPFLPSLLPPPPLPSGKPFENLAVKWRPFTTGNGGGRGFAGNGKFVWRKWKKENSLRFEEEKLNTVFTNVVRAIDSNRTFSTSHRNGGWLRDFIYPFLFFFNPLPAAPAKYRWHKVRNTTVTRP